jgi:hypothetical protein
MSSLRAHHLKFFARFSFIKYKHSRAKIILSIIIHLGTKADWSSEIISGRNTLRGACSPPL